MRNSTILVFLFFMFCMQAQGQTRLVRGTLTDPDTGGPMPGVNVIVKGSATGTTTDINGNYEIEAPVGSILVFSFVGYQSKEVEVSPSPNDLPLDSGKTQKVFRHAIPDDPGRTLSPYFFIKSDDPAVDQMPLKSTSADVHIAGVIADVTVRQVYVNTGERPLEAVYIFPGSTRAAVHAMNMMIGNRRLVAAIREKEQARRDYEVAKQVGKTATLLEQKRPNVFQMNVANILPGDTISVELKYTEALVPVNGTYEFVYPTVVGPRYSETPDDGAHAGEKWVETPYRREGIAADYAFDLSTTLNTGIPIQRITCPSHKVKVDYKSKSSAVIQLDKSEVSGGNRDVIIQYRLRGGKIESGLLLCPRQDENFFLLMMEPPEAPALDEIPPREYIFVVDVSGSMNGFPLGVAKRLLRKLISSLRPTDVFNVLLFESENRMLHPRSVKANPFNIANAVRLLDMAQGGGGTRLYSALQTAFEHEKPEGYSRTFVVVTDGYVTIEKEAFNLVRRNLGTANLFAFGIGTSVNRYLIEGLAHAGMGEPFIVTDESEADAIGKKFIDLIEHPVLTNIRIDYGSLGVYDAVPLSVPDVFVERPIVIFGKYRGKTDGTIKLSGYSGKEFYVNRIEVSSADSDNNDALRYLWARNQIKYLDDYAQFYEDNNNGGRGFRPTQEESRVKKVTELGLKYNLLTQYTSFIAIDSAIRNHGGDQLRMKQPLPLPQGVSNSAVSLAGLSLAPDVTALAEVIVTGYGVTREQRSVSYAVQSVNQSSISNVLSVGDALQGRVAGVTINQVSPGPTSGQTIRVRGNISLSSASEPLYIIDGVPFDNTEHPMGPAGADYPTRINDINSHDIESIHVLKSGTASAIYGSRGANGVVIITTKKPQVGKPRVGFSSSVAFQGVNKLPELQNTFAQGRPVNGMEQWRGPETGETFSWGPALNTLTHDGSSYPFDKHGRLISRSGDATPAMAYDPYNLFRKGLTTDYYISLGNTHDRLNYSVTFGDTKQRGVIPGSSSNRTTLKLFAETVRQGFKVGSRLLIAHTGSDAIQRGNSSSSVMFGLLTTPPSFDNGNGKSGIDALEDPSTYQLGAASQRSYSPGEVDNPYWSISKNPFKATINRAVATVYGEIDLTPALSLNANVSLDQYVDKQRSGFDIGSTASSMGQFTDRDEVYRGLNSEVIVNGRTDAINGDLEISGMAGVVSFFSKREIARTDGFNLNEAGNFEGENASMLSKYSTSYNLNNARLVTSGNAVYKRVLSLDLKSVWERTSTMADRSLWSGGVGFAFNFSELPWVNSSYLVSSGKLFTSLGRIQKEAPLFVDPNYLIAGNSAINDAVLNVERVIASAPADLKPEEVTSFEAGVNIALIESRIDVTITGYVNKTNNLLIPQFTGSSAVLLNGGTLSTRGLDINLTAMPVSGVIKWNIGVNFTTYRSVVRKLNTAGDRIALAGFQTISKNLIEGQPYGVLFGTRYLRNDQGSMVIGNDGFPLVDPEPGVLGNPNPDWLIGVENSISFKGFTLRFLVDTKHGGVAWNGTKNSIGYYGTSKLTAGQREIKSYVFEGVNINGEPNSVPVDFVDPSKDVTQNRWTRYGIAGVAEDAIENASWARMREFSLSYEFGDNINLPLGIRRINVGFTGRNLFLFTKYSGIDPDTSLTGSSAGVGLDYFNLPNTRSYGFSVKFGL